MRLQAHAGVRAETQRSLVYVLAIGQQGQRQVHLRRLRISALAFADLDICKVARLPQVDAKPVQHAATVAVTCCKAGYGLQHAGLENMFAKIDVAEHVLRAGIEREDETRFVIDEIEFESMLTNFRCKEPVGVRKINRPGLFPLPLFLVEDRSRAKRPVPAPFPERSDVFPCPGDPELHVGNANRRPGANLQSQQQRFGVDAINPPRHFRRIVAVGPQPFARAPLSAGKYLRKVAPGQPCLTPELDCLHVGQHVGF